MLLICLIRLYAVIMLNDLKFVNSQKKGSQSASVGKVTLEMQWFTEYKLP